MLIVSLRAIRRYSHLECMWVVGDSIRLTFYTFQTKHTPNDPNIRTTWTLGQPRIRSKEIRAAVHNIRRHIHRDPRLGTPIWRRCLVPDQTKARLLNCRNRA